MTPEQQRLQEIFTEALHKTSPEEREAYLAATCSHDTELRKQVDTLLEAQAESGNFLRENVINGNGAGIGEGPGTIVGRYKLLQEIGEGGFGVVFMAEQQEPVRRMVALKILKPGMDTKEVVARFEAGRQALALMDHPNIARVLDGGATESGRPYFVMELVKGVPLTEFCKQHQLSIEERLQLFIKVCAGVQHAHQKGVIHRDIKPSNVLVTLHDGEAVPKVIDFGIAKAIGQKLTERTLFTRFEQLLGTPAYMSPEQAEWSGLDIDTRSDLYSLGVLLYELLTGTTPIQKETLARIALDELRRMIREVEPPKPSTRLTSLTGTLSARRDSHSTFQRVRGDLDWIVMKALEKDRTRRYETVNGLARDMERHLNGEPVLARPPTVGYRLQKFVRKHRFTVGIATAFVLFLAVAAGTSTYLAVRAGREQARAEQAEKKATRKAEETEAVLGFLTDKVLAAARPEGQEGGLGREVTVRQAVVTAESQIEQAFTNQPLAEAEIRDALGQTFIFLGDYDKAIQQLVRVMALANLALAPDDPRTLDYLNNLAVAYRYADRLDDAIPLLREALKRRKVSFGPDDPGTVMAINNLAVACWRANRLQEALPLFEEASSKTKANLGPDHPDTLKSMHNLACAYQVAGLLQQAVAVFEEVLQKQKAKVGPDHPDTLQYMNNLAETYRAIGRVPEALQLLEEVLQKRKTSLGSDHPDTLQTMKSLAQAYNASGRLPEAIPLMEEALQRWATKLGPDHLATLRAMGDLAGAYSSAGRFAEAELLCRQVLSCRRKNDGTNITELLSLASTLDNLGECLLAQSKHSEAEPFLRESLAIYENSAPGKLQEFSACNRLGNALLGQEKYADAEVLLLRGYQGMKEREAEAPDVPKKLKLTGERLVKLYEAWGKPETAEEWRTKLREQLSREPSTRPIGDGK